MKLLVLGHYEIASNYAISMLVERLVAQSDFDIRVALSGKGDKKLETSSETTATDTDKGFAHLAQYERQLCDELNIGKDSLGLNAMGFDQIADLIGKPISFLINPNSEKGLSKIDKWAPDLIVSIRYRKIFREAAIAIPKLGIINLHSGLLPEYRGAMATFWAMLNKEELYGSTLHFISDQNIDTGAIIKRIPQKLSLRETYLNNVLALYVAGVDAIHNAIDIMQEGVSLEAQIPKNKGVYYSFPQQTDLEAFNKSSGNLY